MCTICNPVPSSAQCTSPGDLATLLPPAVRLLQADTDAEEVPLVLGVSVNATLFRWAARRLRGTTSFARMEHGETSIKLRRWDVPWIAQCREPACRSQACDVMKRVQNGLKRTGASQRWGLD